MQQRPLVFLDIETTGGSPQHSRVLEVGAVRVENGEIVGEFRELVFPDSPVPPFITKLTGITNEEVWDKPLFVGIADKLEGFLADAIFVAHNVQFDYSFLQAEYSRLGRKFSYDRFCTARLSRVLHPEHRRHNLDSLVQRHGLVVTDRHRAFDDAHALYQFYHYCEAQFQDELYRAIQKIMRYSRHTPKSETQALF